MNKYPYIGQGVSDPELVVYFTRPREGIVLGLGRKILCKVNDYFDAWVEGNFKDITKEYITNKKMQVLHEEHAKQINEMAARYGFSSLSDRSIALAKHIYFNEDFVTYSGEYERQYFKEHHYYQIELPFIGYIENPSEHEEVMNDPEDEITKLDNKIADLEKELSDHKCNTEQLLKLTEYLSTHKTLPTRAGDSTVETAIDLLSKYASSLEKEQNDEDILSQIQKVINIVKELVRKCEDDVHYRLETSLEWLNGAYETLYEQERRIGVGDIVYQNGIPDVLYKLKLLSDGQACISELSSGQLYLSDPKVLRKKKGSASK